MGFYKNLRRQIQKNQEETQRLYEQRLKELEDITQKVLAKLQKELFEEKSEGSERNV